MTVLDSLRKIILESFQLLPVLLLSAIFFFGTLTSNIGMLMVVIGALLIPTSITYSSNYLANPKSFFFGDGQNILEIIKYAVLPFFLSLVFSSGVASSESTATGWAAMLLAPVMWIAPFFSQTLSPFQALNPLRWFMDLPAATGPSASCSILPFKDGDSVADDPSYWSNHMMFLLGLLFANAVALYKVPSPQFNTPLNKETQQTVDEKVASRKRIAIGSLVLLSIATLGILYYKFAVTGCERHWSSIVPLTWTAAFGALWYSILTTSCGIRATDLFGIVTTFLPPNINSRPVVCTV